MEPAKLGDMMNTDLPTPSPRGAPGGPVSPADLRSFVQGLEPGWYTTGDLHPRHAAWAGREGREAVSSKTLGEAIRRSGLFEARWAHGHVRVWCVTPELAAGE